MLGIEYRKGNSVIQRETNTAFVPARAYAAAMKRAREVGADKVRFLDASGREIKVYRVPNIYLAQRT